LIPVGWFEMGVKGALWAAATSELALVFAVWIGFRKAGLLSIRRELVPLVGLAAGALIGFALNASVLGWVTHFVRSLRAS
jgi:hypothetical protein